MRDFSKDVSTANKPSIRIAFDNFYRCHFDVKAIKPASQYLDRKRGVDIIIELNNNTGIYTQEKVIVAWNTKYPGSVYVELKMIDGNGNEKAGWVYDECDAQLLALCYEQYRPNDEPKCFGFKMKQFKQVARDNKDRWLSQYRLLETPTRNNGHVWTTHCLLVPYIEIRRLIDLLS